jgi:hypothetical protein
MLNFCGRPPAFAGWAAGAEAAAAALGKKSRAARPAPASAVLVRNSRRVEFIV